MGMRILHLLVMALPLSMGVTACGSSGDLPQPGGDPNGTGGQGAGGSAEGGQGGDGGAVVEVDLVAKEADVPLIPGGPPTHAWTFNGTVPGPTLRARRGDRMVIHFKNELTEETTVHWHGLRIPAAMDGVPMNQAPVPPGGTFEYDFVVPDAGTFWYHPHVSTHHQVDRGMSGMLIVDDPKEPLVEEESLWVIDDWSLDDQNQRVEPSASEDFWGHMGNVWTLTGEKDRIVTLTRGKTQRIRVLNGTNSTFLSLAVEGHSIYVLAKDGPVLRTPFYTDALRIAPAERFDIQLIPTGEPGDHAITVAPIDTMMMAMGSTTGTWTINGLAFPDMEDIQLEQDMLHVLEIQNRTPMSHPFHLHGHFFTVVGRTAGMMGGGGGTTGAPITIGTLQDQGTGAPAPALALQPTDLGTYDDPGTTKKKLTLGLSTMNMPGMGGGADALTQVDGLAWQDTVEVGPMQQVRLAVFADNPGSWMFHCHILEHEENGMMGMLEVGGGPGH